MGREEPGFPPIPPFPGQGSYEEAGSHPHHKVKPKTSQPGPHLKHFLPSPWEAEPHAPVCTLCSPRGVGTGHLACPPLPGLHQSSGEGRP